jgi:hypothetical protein
MDKKHIIQMAWNMQEGQLLNISREDFDEAFPANYLPYGDQRPPVDRFLEQLPGVNYGAYKLEQDYKGDYVLSRHPCGDEKVREDWDRR